MADQVFWVQDSSLETFEPGFVHTESQERQMQLGVNQKVAPLPNGGNVRVDMRLNCNIFVEGRPACIAEISSACLAEKAHFGQNESRVLQDLYVFTREAAKTLLVNAHFAPPLPENLSDIHQ